MYEHERSFAGGLADRAADIGMGLFLGDSLEIRRKADASVVTQADTSIESMVRAIRSFASAWEIRPVSRAATVLQR